MILENKVGYIAEKLKAVPNTASTPIRPKRANGADADRSMQLEK